LFHADGEIHDKAGVGAFLNVLNAATSDRYVEKKKKRWNFYYWGCRCRESSLLESLISVSPHMQDHIFVYKENM
jgi:hypothetical protein